MEPLRFAAKANNSARDADGLTLIELLVVVLIVGVLAAIAIPLFLGQDSQAYNSSAKSLAQAAQTAAETYAAENNGSYAWGNNAQGLTVLRKIEPSINIANASEAKLIKAEEVTKGSGYKVTVIAPETKDEYTIERTSTGEIKHKCASKLKKDCPGGLKSSNNW